jgi:cardiolipin synthase A/B
MFGLLIAVASALAIALAVWLSWRAAVAARTPQGAVGWVVFLLTTPYVAIVLYALFGPHRYRRRSRARQASRLLFQNRRPDRSAITRQGEEDGIDRRPFERIAGLRFVAGNRVDLLIDGEATFAALVDAIDRAERDVMIQFYTFRHDVIGRQMIDRLVAAAGRGVTVRLSIDAVGSSRLSRAEISRMQDAGIEGFRRRWRVPLSRHLQINFRNHRKVLIVDGREAYIGGLNVADIYLGRDKAIGPWRDSFARITGPVVKQLQLVFAEDWHWLTGQALHDALDWDAPAPTGPTEALIVPTGPTDGEDGGAAMFFAAIAQAQSRIWISTPYFVPDAALIAALKLAAMKGREVRVLVPDGIDHVLPWLAAFAYFDELVEAGVEIWRYNAGFLHQKALLIDDRLSGIGSTNFDNRSFRLNFETMGLFIDPELGERMERMLEADFARAERLTTPLSGQPLPIRLGAPLARLFAPVL